MRNFVKKHMSRPCCPSIQQSKRRQALMAASVQDEAEVLFEVEISQRSSDVDHDCDHVLDSDDSLWDDTLSDIGTNSISINEGDEE